MQKTLLIIKPDSVSAKNSGKIIDFIENEGFTIKSMKLKTLSSDEAGEFYAEHMGKHFYDNLKEFMTSGPCIPIILERDEAILHLREVIGATDPAKAAQGTIRNLYGEGGTRNAVHGSDSPESAQRECSFFFPNEV
ncbi:MAG: nucleoside-diphosphate kinase [Spirochaetes bacterium]|nr:nucleoside-diphosphate kinase [Spirochaetota bacterium]